MKKKFYEKPDITVINFPTEKSIFTGSIGEFDGKEWTDEDGDGI